MPNYDSGHYFLTVLVPLKVEPMVAPDGALETPANGLRRLLALMPTSGDAEITLAGSNMILSAIESSSAPPQGGRPPQISPFARNTLNHFVRLAMIDAINFNGRLNGNQIFEAVRRIDPSIPQEVDCLSRPFLLFSVEFDFNLHGAPEPDVYLDKLWATMNDELRLIFGHCHDFEQVQNAGDFVRYIKACQLDTTMPYCDYWITEPDYERFSLWVALAIGGAAALIVGGGLAWLLGGKLPEWLLWPVAILSGLVAGVAAIVSQIVRHGSRSFPTAHGSSLENVLKALYLQKNFADFAAQNQGAPPQVLYDAFQQFLLTHRPSATQPTQRPGVIGA
jgi:hypothetical protein